MKKFVKVPIERYIELKPAENDLYILEGIGVDNWFEYGKVEFEKYTENDITLPIIEEE